MTERVTFSGRSGARPESKYMDFSMLRDAKVEARELQDHNGSHAVITVNDQFEHVFHAKSRVSEALGMMTPKELGQKMTGGSFFFVGEDLVDYKDGHYHGFSHTDDALESLMRVIGAQDVEKERKTAHRLMNRTQSNDLALSRVWDQTEIVIPHYQQGGDFTSQLSFQWSPFEKNIKTKFELIRQICTNGMIGLTPFVNMSIPLVNRWEEHIDIANKQLQNKITGMMSSRLEAMMSSRASVADAQLLDKHVMQRLMETTNVVDRERLQAIYDVVDPYTNLCTYYKAEVFDNKAMAAQVPAHITVFDAWNITTEVCQHSQQVQGSSDAGLQKLANSLLFDRECTVKRVAHIGKNIDLSPFSSAERAFFGDVATV